MAQSKLELAVGTGQWDAGLKKAQQALNSFTQAQGGLQQALQKDNGDMQKFIQMMGKMDSTAATTKGQMNDYKRVLEQLTADYNKMSDAQKKSIGTDYLQTIDALKQKFKDAKQQVDEFNRSLGNTSEIKLPEGGSGLFGGGKLDGMLQVFGGNLMTKGAGVLAGLASEMGDMVKQGIELAKQGEGIRIAFERLGRGDILDGLREATHGTVTDLELMKAAVKFNDFKLPVEELGTMLAFAQQKAKDTGQSVDYMVDSIVTGLGRKSLMILDNLGLSAAEIREKMKETGDMTKAVGAIIREQMEAAGDYVETAADRAAQANVSLQNKMEELGRKFAPVEEASNQLWTSMKIGILDIVGGPLAQLLNGLTEAGRIQNSLQGMNSNEQVNKQLGKLRVAKANGSNYMLNSLYSEQIEQYNRQINKREQQVQDVFAWQRGERGDALKNRINAITSEYGILDTAKIRADLDATRKMLADYRAGAAEIMKPTKVDVDTSKAVKNITELQKKLKNLEEDRKKAVLAGDNEQVDLLTKQINEVKQNIGYLDPNALKEKKDLDELQKVQKKIADLTKEAYTADGERLNTIQKEIDGLQEQERKLLKIKDLVTGKGPDLDKLFPDNSAKNFNTGYAGSAQAKYDSARVDLALGPMNFDAINTYISGIKGVLKDANLGDELYTSMTEKLKDATTVSTLLQEMMERGLAGADLESTAQALKEKLLSPEGIDQTAIQSFLEELNKQIEEAGGVGLKLNADTGEVTDDKEKGKDGDGLKDLKKFNDGIGKLSGGLSQVTGGLKAIGVKIPEEVDQVIGVISGVGQIISGVGTFISIFQTSALTANTIALGALTSAVTANTFAKFIPFLANGGVVPAFAQGGTIPKFADGGLIGCAALGMTIPGNSMSGDRLRLPVDGGRGMIGVNSGELILNKSSQNTLAADLLNAEALIGSIKDYSVSLGNTQQAILAQELEGNSRGGYNSQPYLDGELIYLGLQAYLRRSGKGEIVTANR